MATEHILDDHDLHLIDRHWRAANYLSVGQIPEVIRLADQVASGMRISA